jgi:UDP-GlcNAc:undecaprenyl-phosphate GlcNAc-1-phosphate transferase
MIYLIIFFIILNILIIRNFHRIRKLFPIDHFDSKRKKKYKKIPLAGGVIIIFNFILLFFLSKFSIFNIIDLFNTTIIFYSIIFFLLGYVDDKFDLSANLKLIFQAIIAIHFFEINDNYLIKEIKFSSLDLTVNLGKFSTFFSILALLLFMNAINMFDGINGQVCAYSIFFLLIFLLKNYQINLITFLIIFLISFFLINIYNKAYLGSSGVFLISFILSFLSIDAHKNGVIFADEILLIMLLPGLDMVRLFFIRILERRNPFSPDNQHLHHYFQIVINSKKTFIYIFGIVVCSWISKFFLNQYVSILLTTFFYLSLIFFFKKIIKK